MTRGAKASAVALAVVLTLVGYATRPDARVYGPTSFGTTPHGFGAVFDLLVALDQPVARSYAPIRELSAEATVWWIRPQGLCAEPEATEPEDGGEAREPGAEPAASGDPGAALVRFAEAGGTALVFLGPDACPGLGRLVLPERTDPACGCEDEAEAGAPPGGEAGAEPAEVAEPVERRIEGPVLAEGRVLETPSLRLFRDEAEGWRTLLATESGAPLALERPIGEGRLVVAADARFLRNRWLGRADAALLAFDLVRAFGPPLFDERRHGLRAQRSGALYLARSPAALLFGGLALLGLAYAWRGAALPPRTVDGASPEPPSLDAFVDSLASLYARSREYERILEHYRELTALRLRRSLDLPVETPTRALVERLRRSPRVSEAGLRLLAEGASVRREAELRSAVEKLDDLLKEVAA